MDKTAIKNYAIYARRKLIQSAKDKAALIGVYEDRIVASVSKGDGFELYKSNIGTETRLNATEIQQRNNLVSKIQKDGFEQTIEEVAYTWFNRLIAIRFMEVNDYLPSRIRVLSSENQGQVESDLMLHPFDSEIFFTNNERQYVFDLKETNKSDELFKFLFIKQCDDLSKYLPGLFVETKDYMKLLFDIRFNDQEDVVFKLVNEIPESNFNVELEGQIEIIGWLYQYYNTEPKDKVYARPKGQKIGKNNIPAVTQLFTPDWIVKYMVENSLGRLWLNGHPNNNLKSNWKYYLDEAEQEEDVKKELDKIKQEHANLKIEEIKLIDPCMGSGHILVYAFEVFMQLYLENGYSEREASVSILKNNLYGLDIDERAYQLSYFALMMKARQYNRRILTLDIKPNLYAFEETTQFIRDNLFRLGDLKELGLRISDDFDNAKELGSIMKIHYTKQEIDSINQILDEIDRMADYGDLFTQADSIRFVEEFSKLVDLATVMSNKYDVVVTNPPYTPISNCNIKLNEYAQKFYVDSKTDLYSIFIEKCHELNKANGYQAMITMHSWMFLTSYKKLREKLLNSISIVNMAHLGARAFEEITGEVVQTTTFVINNTELQKYQGVYKRLIEYNNSEKKEINYFDCKNEYLKKKNEFYKIPGIPIAYWVSEIISNSFEGLKLGDIATCKSGIMTGSDITFTRCWYEPNISNVDLECNQEKYKNSNHKWFPINTGGFRKWYGNLEMVVNVGNHGYDIKHKENINFRLREEDYYFREGIVWSEICTGTFSARFARSNTLFFVTAPIMIPKSVNTYNLLALINSKYANYIFDIINPTLHYNLGCVESLPVKKVDNNIVEYTCRENIKLCKEDWDSFETSWDFLKHPFIRLSNSLWDTTSIASTIQYYNGNNVDVSCPLELCYLLWQGECNERFKKLKENEEKLNHIFNNIYGLKNELTPEIADKDVTVRKANLVRDIKSFISYAVGCMFGRYSLDNDGLAYAGGDWYENKYESFIPDKDNVIPIFDEEYFEDDIVGQFIRFVSTVFGEESLEVNLDYIAKTLGGSGTSREIIRKYFLNDFFKDHCQTYQVTGSGKRPIYWQFDSGKQNGFKALIYMHRYDEDLVSRVRTDYLHNIQSIYEDVIKNDEYTIEHSNIKSEVTSARKHMEKVQKQLAETKIYDQALGHIANQRIGIDLDDGVKINYEKFQGVEVINEGSKKIKVDLLTKLK